MNFPDENSFPFLPTNDLYFAHLFFLSQTLLLWFVSKVGFEIEVDQSEKIHFSSLKLSISQNVLLAFLSKHEDYNDLEIGFDIQHSFLEKLFVNLKIDSNKEHDDNSFVHLIENHFSENYFVKTFDCLSS